ncbi:CDP-diacylglycerol--glycerol-3-phosphate 3-phosphatidyltransferase [Trichlorobacter thiogenes]|uniref:CDP-diacylglycerol--glycerol-3-phosphate 3-phosphatidyltransferase n=1 Tax=Trichlorobacter thiogenes TaxID=115783 RepID=A0A1T4Q065_9BACT|nr:CDP-diacylglycerol--glycerol-3-phosphate 3-phosphatidyltransferase [Trichlorobacter thiogenes]SJZ97119.1 CDP-diacylglycerol--glycerol-3-phosphate 3-phosphatidyltransferase [Trichlorobacter thiogenes]
MSQHHPILNPPNILTLFRVACIPLMIVLLFSDSRESCFWAAWVFAIASATDWIDGHLARRMGIETVFGKFLDPIADKLIVTAALIMILPFNRVPAWMVFVILAREIVITGLRSIASSEGIVIQASDLGKYKTIFQLTAIIGLLLHYEYNWLFGIAHPLLTVNMHNAGMFFFWIAFVLTVWSGVDYLARFIKVIAR